MVNAIAPKAPSGASFMMMPTMPKNTCAVWSMMLQQRLAALAQELEREGEQDREEQHLQDLALGEGADHGGRDDVQEEVERGLLGRLLRVGGDALGVERVGVDVHADAGLPDVDDHEADDQRDRGHDLEVDQRLDPDPADLLHVLHAGDAVHHGAEDDRGDQHLDQLDEGVAERLHAGAELGVEVPEQDAQHDGAQDLDVEVPVPGLVVRRGHGRDGGCCHGTLP